MEEEKHMGYGTREDLRDILNFVKNMGSLVEDKGMEATGQSYFDAVEETEWISRNCIPSLFIDGTSSRSN